MKFGAVSDSHRNERLLRRAAETLLAAGAETLLHAGDYYPDADWLEGFGVPVVRVAGVGEPEYDHPAIPRCARVPAGDAVGALVHRPEDLPADGRFAFVVYGHTHRWELRSEGGTLYVNPGHCKASRDRDRAPSCALLDVGADGLSAAVFDLAGTVLRRWPE